MGELFDWKENEEIFHYTSRQYGWLVFCLSKFYQWAPLVTVRTALVRLSSSRPLSVLTRGAPSCFHRTPHSLSSPSLRGLSLSDRSLPDALHLPGVYNPSRLDTSPMLSMKPSSVTLIPTTSPFPLTLKHNLVQCVTPWCLPATFFFFFFSSHCHNSLQRAI